MLKRYTAMILCLMLLCASARAETLVKKWPETGEPFGEDVETMRVIVMGIGAKDSFLIQCGSQRGKSHRTAVIALDNHCEELSVQTVQSQLVDFQFLQSCVRNFTGDFSVSQNLCKISHPLQQTIGNSRRSS